MIANELPIELLRKYVCAEPQLKTNRQMQADPACIELLAPLRGNSAFEYRTTRAINHTHTQA